MFRSQRATPTTLADTLGALPAGMKVFLLDEAWLVVGRCGLFVVTEDEGDLAAASLRAASLADAVRLQLSDELVWVPFIDAMCATHEVQFDPDQPCLIVPHDLVAHTVSTGPDRIDPETLERLDNLRYPVLR